MDKQELKKKIDERIFGEYKQDIRVMMPKPFLVELKKIINQQNEEISKQVAVGNKENTELLKELIEENQKTRELTEQVRLSIEKNKIDKVEISNFPEQKEVKIPKFPSKIDIKEPKWYERFDYKSIGEFVKQGFTWHSKQPLNLDKYKEKDNALAVRLVDKEGKKFYDAFFQAIQGGGFRNVTVDNFPADYPDAAGAALLTTIDADTSSLESSISGAGTPSVDSYTSDDVNLAANTANQQVVAAPGASKQIWVYGFAGTAGTGDGSISIQDEDDTALSGVMPVAENGGFVMSPSGNYAMPWIKVATNKALEIDTVTCSFDGIITYAVVSV